MRVLLILFFGITTSLLGSCNAPAGGRIDVSGKRARAHVAKLVAFGERPAGSKALERSRKYLEGELKKLGLASTVQSFRDKAAPGIHFHNLLCEIPGTDKHDDRLLVLGSHYDTKLTKGHDRDEHNFKFVGANDGGSSSGLLLELARYFRKHPLRCRLLLVWFDGEESLEFDWNDDKALFGSKHCVKMLRKRFPKTRPLYKCVPVMVLLDMIGDPKESITRDELSSRRLQRIVAESAKKLRYSKHFFKKQTEVTDDHIPFKNRSIEVLDLIQFGPPIPAWWHTKDDTLDKVSAKSLEIVGKVVAHALPRIVEACYEKLAAPKQTEKTGGTSSKKTDDGK